FILVNHPLDCPVCDKGGECPLQDLTFRYGPGNTRMSFEKLTLEKPIPISPAISLDRERCILCYRCTRFSEAVSEDGQLVAANRGSMSVITTFEDDPYSGPFTGNVIELCPVGALLPTQYRFEGRPWEIQSVPTVCGMCPVGCNTWVDMREGKAKRVRSRNHAEIDEGWVCDTRGATVRASPTRWTTQRTPSTSCSSGLDLAVAAAFRSHNTPSGSASPARRAAAPSTSRRRRTAAASPTPGRPAPTRSPPA